MSFCLTINPNSAQRNPAADRSLTNAQNQNQIQNRKSDIAQQNRNKIEIQWFRIGQQPASNQIRSVSFRFCSDLLTDLLRLSAYAHAEQIIEHSSSNAWLNV